MLKHPPLVHGLELLPCALREDMLYIPHADGNWVSAAKLQPFSLGIIKYWRAEQLATPAAQVDESANLHAAVADRPELLRNLQTWLICREIGNALQPALATVQSWVSALTTLTGQPAPDFLMRAKDSAEVEPGIACCIAQLDVWNGRLEAAIDRQAHVQLDQHANDETAAGDRDPMEQLP